MTRRIGPAAHEFSGVCAASRARDVLWANMALACPPALFLPVPRCPGLPRSRRVARVHVNLPAAADSRPGAGATDAAAFDALVGPLVDYGYRLAYSMLGNWSDAEDAVQEATLKAWRNLHRLADQSAVRPWFLTIVANQCRSMRRGRWWSVIKLAEPERESAGPEDTAVRRTEMQRALARLGREDRLALQLRHYMDLPLEEVAAVLGVSVTAAKSRIHRAEQRLRPALTVPEDLS